MFILAIDSEIALKFLNFPFIQIINNIFLKRITQVHSYASNPAKGLTDFTYSTCFESLFQVEGHHLRDNRVQTLLVVLNALVESAEEEVAAFEVGRQVGGFRNFPDEALGEGLIVMALEVLGADLQVDCLPGALVVYPDDFALLQQLN